MQYSLKIFEKNDHTHFRMLDIDGEPWLVIADACNQLDLKPNNGSYFRHAERLDDDEKRLVARSIVDGAPSPLKGVGLKSAPVGASLLMINESGLYSLILRSKRPEAKKFKKWITSEVLPSIRKTGGFPTNKTPALIQRYNDNWDRVESEYFSGINELTVRLWGRLEKVGHIMADRAADGKEIKPDTANKRRFSDWLKLNHPALCGNISYYQHKTRSGRARRVSTRTRCCTCTMSTSRQFGFPNTPKSTSGL